MPRAVSANKASALARSASSETQYAREASSRNPLFNTERYGQHILKNPLVAQGIVDKANLKSTDKVLEVGPGTGNLTVRILEQCSSCTAVEMDPRLAAELQKRLLGKVEAKKLHILVGDIIKTDLPFFDVCISNTPYQISSPLIFKLLSQRPLPRVAVLMFQREFAHRLVARPGDQLWNRLSANVQLYAKVSHVMKVGRNNFRPPPQVESSVVRIEPHCPPPTIAFGEFDGMTRILFARRNKTVRANFGAKGVLDMLDNNREAWRNQMAADRGNTSVQDHALSTPHLVAEILELSGAADLRAAKMDIDQILALLAAFHQRGVHFA